MRKKQQAAIDLAVKKALFDSAGNAVVNVRNISEELRLYNGSVGPYETIWKTQPAVRRTVDFIARSIARLNIKVYDRVSTTDRVELPEALATRVLHNPNPKTTQYRLWYGTVSDIAIFDVAYWTLVRSGSRLSLVRLPVRSLTPEGGNFLGPERYRLPDGSTIPADQVIVFPGYDPQGIDEGVAPMEALRRILAEDNEASKYREDQWRNGNRSGAVIIRPVDAPQLSDTARENFWQRWRSAVTGRNNAGGDALLEEGESYQERAAFSSKDSEFIPGRELTDKEVARAFHLPLAMAGLLEASNWGIGEYHRMLYTETLPSWLERMTQEVDLQLLPQLGASATTYTEFDVEKYLKGDIADEAQAANLLVGGPTVTVAEWRARNNLAFIEGTDTLIEKMDTAQGNNQGNPTADVQPADVPAKAVGGEDHTLSQKAVPRSVLRRRDATVEKHTKVLSSYFERQRNAALGGKAVDSDRWNKELHADLFAIGTQTATEAGKRVAARAKGSYDEARTLAYIEENTRIAAESINAKTKADLADAVKNADDAVEATKHVFDVALSERVGQLALSRATSMTNFGRTEAAHQNGLKNKTWVVPSDNSRHPELDGETVPLGKTFSNGLRYPGDPEGDAAETAGCSCLLDLS